MCMSEWQRSLLLPTLYLEFIKTNTENFATQVTDTNHQIIKQPSSHTR